MKYKKNCFATSIALELKDLPDEETDKVLDLFDKGSESVEQKLDIINKTRKIIQENSIFRDTAFLDYLENNINN